MIRKFLRGIKVSWDIVKTSEACSQQQQHKYLAIYDILSFLNTLTSTPVPRSCGSHWWAVGQVSERARLSFSELICEWWLVSSGKCSGTAAKYRKNVAKQPQSSIRPYRRMQVCSYSAPVQTPPELPVDSLHIYRAFAALQRPSFHIYVPPQVQIAQ